MAYLFILLGIMFRLLPHLPNATPVAAIALFGGCYLERRTALIVPFVIMVVSDLFIGLHPLAIFVWGSFLLTGMIGMWLKDHRSFLNTIGGTMLSSILFFGITNFGVWVMPGSWYPHTWQGFVNCYVMAIPFFRNTLIGDLFYVGLLFGSYELVQAMVHQLKGLRSSI